MINPSHWFLLGIRCRFIDDRNIPLGVRSWHQGGRRKSPVAGRR